jgi:hypothetical protein
MHFIRSFKEENMPINYKDDWDKIQEALILAGSNPNLQERVQAEDALKIKLAVESIKHQEALAKTTKVLTWATIGLAFFTAVLVFVTAFCS